MFYFRSSHFMIPVEQQKQITGIVSTLNNLETKCTSGPGYSRSFYLAANLLIHIDKISQKCWVSPNVDYLKLKVVFLIGLLTLANSNLF